MWTSPPYNAPALQDHAAPRPHMPSNPNTPATHTPPARSGFVTVLGAVSLGLAAIGVCSGLVQAAALWLAPDDLLSQLLAGLRGGWADAPSLPASLTWSLDHLAALNTVGTLLSALLLAVSWGLLMRHNWGRIGFIAFLLLGVLVNLAGLLLMWQMQQWILALNTSLGDPALEAQMRSFGMATMALAAVCTLLLAVLHVWLVRRLCTPAVRAEFGIDPDQ